MGCKGKRMKDINIDIDIDWIWVIIICATLWVINDNSKSIELAKAGLEECHVEHTPKSKRTIWVKDCTKVLETMAKAKEIKTKEKE
jgi:hypothetical protein